MKDDTADISTATAAPDAGAAHAPARKKARKKRAKSSPKSASNAATSAIEARIGHTFADSALLVTAMTHVSALKPWPEEDQPDIAGEGPLLPLVGRFCPLDSKRLEASWAPLSTCDAAVLACSNCGGEPG